MTGVSSARAPVVREMQGGATYSCILGIIVRLALRSKVATGGCPTGRSPTGDSEAADALHFGVVGDLDLKATTLEQRLDFGHSGANIVNLERHLPQHLPAREWLARGHLVLQRAHVAARGNQLVHLHLKLWRDEEGACSG